MPYSPTVVANNILARAFKEKLYPTPMKLQKILYFVSSQYIKKTGHPLLESPFLTWAYGPVVYTVYDEFRPFSKNGIKRYARDAAGQSYIVDENKDRALEESLSEVWEATKHRGAVDLSKITHKESSAWDKAYQRGENTLNWEDVKQDRTYVDELGLANAH
ncbi:Panacea domain-containing protein [Corynebacterium pyruviciproducens]|uniref:Panacea domain-containing protein n=1 Tax=Corynebacterium pyruviciproducens TaxID=598660 RepID=UPI0023F48115|nr:type II toxin-antitoxin system antitoxin SocA domain-containing protein [Corynebacterium pyruviciproducens]